MCGVLGGELFLQGLGWDRDVFLRNLGRGGGVRVYLGGFGWDDGVVLWEGGFREGDWKLGELNLRGKNLLFFQVRDLWSRIWGDLSSTAEVEALKLIILSLGTAFWLDGRGSDRGGEHGWVRK